MGPIEIKDTGKYGRGLFATCDIKKDELVEVSPVIVSPHDEWKDLKRATDSLLLLLLLGRRLYSHRIRPWFSSLIIHILLFPTFKNNEENSSIDFYALHDIKEGEELTINYHGDPDNKKPLWFEVIE